MVGMDANLVTDPKEPTMVLSCLQQHPLDLQRSLVIHEFGHALGLEHEHQRSDFWNVLRKHFDTAKIIKAVYHDEVEKARKGFEANWLELEKEPSETVLTEYDPESIMHYM